MATGLQKIQRELRSRADKRKAAILQRFFKTGPGEYGAGDIFLGLPVPLQRQIAKKYSHLSRLCLRPLLKSKIHEFRLVALLILTAQYESAISLDAKKKIVGFYLKNARFINNWDLVDLSAYKILGDFLLRFQANPIILYKLARSSNLWERRMAVVATYAFIKAGRTKEVFLIAGKLLEDKHDLIHKATGWMLREAGKRTGADRLKRFLDKHHKTMPRTALRYAIERLSPAEKRSYLSGGKLSLRL